MNTSDLVAAAGGAKPLVGIIALGLLAALIVAAGSLYITARYGE